MGDIKDDILITKFMTGIANMAAFGNAFKNVAALVGDLDFTFPEVEEVKKFLEDPEAYKKANPGGGSATAAAAPAAAAKKEEKAAVVEEEEEEEMEFDLFG